MKEIDIEHHKTEVDRITKLSWWTSLLSSLNTYLLLLAPEVNQTIFKITSKCGDKYTFSNSFFFNSIDENDDGKAVKRDNMLRCGDGNDDDDSESLN